MSLPQSLFAVWIVVSATAACTSSQAPAPGKAAPSSTYVNTDTSPYTSTSSDTGSDTDTGSGTGEGTGIDLTPDCDPDKEFHKLAYPQDVKDCLSRGKLYNFDANGCTQMNRAYDEFKCQTFDGLKEEITSVGVKSTGSLDSQRSSGGKLISCGVNADGDIIVAQVFHRNKSGNKNECKFSKAGKVVSLCFRVFTSGNPPPTPSDEGAQRAYVAECMSNE